MEQAKWVGYLEHENSKTPFSIERLVIKDKLLFGYGIDNIGDFQIKGVLISDNQVEFKKVYKDMHPMHFKGTINGLIMEGKWLLGLESGTFKLESQTEPFITASESFSLRDKYEHYTQSMMKFDSKQPEQFKCPFCYYQGVSNVKTTYSVFAYMGCCCLTCSCCVLGCCLFPFIFKECHDVTHCCPNCKKQVGENFAYVNQKGDLECGAITLCYGPESKEERNMTSLS